MASKLAQQVAQAQQARSRVRDFYLEVCRCLPFIQRLHKLEEIATLRELRAVVKHKFNEYKGAKDPRVVDLLIFKGREELECYLMMHKNRHHCITEYIEPFNERLMLVKAKTHNSPFLDTFYTTPYPQITQKQ